jgi:hypothetical protein
MGNRLLAGQGVAGYMYNNSRDESTGIGLRSVKLELVK